MTKKKNNNTNLTFKEWINSIPKKQLTETKKQITALCQINEETLNRWIREEYSPRPVYRTIINALAGVELLYLPTIKNVKIPCDKHLLKTPLIS